MIKNPLFFSRPMLFLLAIAGSSVDALEFNVEYTDNRPYFPPAIWVEISGEIEVGDSLEFLDAIAPFRDYDVQEIVLSFDSPGGSLTEGIELGRTIADLGVKSRATVGIGGSPGICASACVYAFLGATYRFVAGNSRIGVHQFYMNSSDLPSDHAISLSQVLSSEIVNFLQQREVDPELFSIMSNTSSSEVLWLTNQELFSLRVVTGSVAEEAVEYVNISGSLALRIGQESQYGSNQLTLACGDLGLVAIARLNEPEFAFFGALEVVINGAPYTLGDAEIVAREENIVTLVASVPENVRQALSAFSSVGARIMAPTGDVFFGFDGEVFDARIAETATTCEVATVPATQDTDKMEIFDGWDIQGADLTKEGFRGTDLSDCIEICRLDRNCLAISYVKEKRWCWPKGAGGQPVQDIRVISAVK